MNNTVNSNTAAKNQNFVIIPKEDYPRIVWKLQRIEGVIGFLHEKLTELKQETKLIALPSLEVGGFCDVLHDDAFIGLCEVSEQLIESDVDGFQQVGHKLRDIANYAGFVMNFLLLDKPGHKPEHRNIYRSDVDSIFSLIEEMRHGLLACIDGLKNFTSNDLKKHAHKEESYESVMTERIKAIQPKFTALCVKYIFPGVSELLTGAEEVRKETEKLRHEISELQNGMPVKSEESMDCGLAIDLLDFLTRLIDSKFDFRVSDLLVLSLLADQASAAFGSSLSQLKLDDGGTLAKDSLH